MESETGLAQVWIKHLGLKEHPEGGFYSEIYRSDGLIPALALTETHSGHRSFMTSIFFMLKSGQVSNFHRLKSDEVWYYHAGSSVTIHQIFPSGDYKQLHLGPDLLVGQSFQHLVVAGTWFGATVDSSDSPALMGCAVAPGFEFQDFELASRLKLQKEFPGHKSIIELLTR